MLFYLDPHRVGVCLTILRRRCEAPGYVIKPKTAIALRRCTNYTGGCDLTMGATCGDLSILKGHHKTGVTIIKDTLLILQYTLAVKLSELGGPVRGFSQYVQRANQKRLKAANQDGGARGQEARGICSHTHCGQIIALQ